MTKLFVITFAASITLCSAVAPAALGQADKLSPAELTALLKKPNIGVTAKNVQVVGTGPNVTVLAQKNPSDGENDLKVDAVFISKALILGAPGQIERVKVIFSQTGRDGRFVSVTKQQINDYGSGKINGQQLLGALDLLSVHEEKGPDLQQGPDMERRLLVWQRIEKLKRQGTGVKPFEAIFQEIESTLKSGSTEIEQKLSFLEAKLTEQEEHLKQAKTVQRGLGVPASKHATNAPATRKGDAPTPTLTSGQVPTFIPPDADRLKQMFYRDANSQIRTVEGKNRANGQALRDLKLRIEQCFSANRPAEAFMYMHQFQTLVQQVTGSSGPMGGEGPPGGGPPGGMPGGGPPGLPNGGPPPF